MRLEIETTDPEGSEKATPVLFVHGALHSSWCWKENFMPYFSGKGYTCHALNLRGHGGSEGRERLRWASIGNFVDDLAQAVDELGQQPILIGHSMGGYTVQRYLETCSAPAAVLLASIPTRGLFPFILRYSRRHLFTTLRCYATLDFYYAVRQPDLARRIFFSADMPEGQVERYFSLLQPESARAVVDMQFLSFPHPGRVKGTPILVTGAENDAFITRKELEKTARAYGTEAVIFPDMAHDMMLEAGWRDVADVVLDWLANQLP